MKFKKTIIWVIPLAYSEVQEDSNFGYSPHTCCYSEIREDYNSSYPPHT